ncbi:Arm DNA-binding domain-containing protein [Enterococcus gallinarum]|nr:Arm DNA-binding domain-containing protein [Enterococcus gallinarum]
MIKEYTKKDGSQAYLIKVYLGIDPLTGKKRFTTRRGFRTQKEAKMATNHGLKLKPKTTNIVPRKIILSIKSKIYG